MTRVKLKPSFVLWNEYFEDKSGYIIEKVLKITLFVSNFNYDRLYMSLNKFSVPI